MTHPLRTSGLLTTALLAWATLDAIAPHGADAQAADKPNVDSASSVQLLPVPTIAPPIVIPGPVSQPLPQVPGRDYIPFQPVGEVVPNVLPDAAHPVVPPAGAIAGIEIEVVPFTEEAGHSLVEVREDAAGHAPIAGEIAAGTIDQLVELPPVESAIISGGEADEGQAGEGQVRDRDQSLPAVEAEYPVASVQADIHTLGVHDPEVQNSEVQNSEAQAAIDEATAEEKSQLLAIAAELPTPESTPEPRGWFDRQMAETTARQRSQREAQLRENLIAAVRDHVAQNNVTAAQQIAQNPVFLDAERTALRQAIATAQPTVDATGTKVEPTTELAKEVARLAARQTWLLERLPAIAGSDCGVAEITLSAASQPLPDCSARRVESNYGWLIQAANRSSVDFSGILPLATAAPITSRYGWRIHPIYGNRRFHAGVDFGAPLGTPVHASLSGRVETSEYLDGYGFTVILESSSAQERHLYAHLADMAVQSGQWVEQGQVIGWVGNTGNSTGPHLHYEVHRLGPDGWATVDPLALASQRNASL